MAKITRINGDYASRKMSEWGLDGVPSYGIDFYLYDNAGIFAVRGCQFGGVEVHMAFDPKKRRMAREASIAMMDILPRPIFAFVTGNRQSVVNLTKKLDFVDLGLFMLSDSKGERVTRILRAD